MEFGPLPRPGISTRAVASSRRQAQLPFSSLLPFLSSGREGLGLFCSLKDTFRKIRKRGGLQQQSLRAVIILQVRAKRKGQLDFPGRSLRSPFKFAVILTLVTSVRLSDRSAGLLASAEIITASEENALRAGGVRRAVDAVRSARVLCDKAGVHVNRLAIRNEHASVGARVPWAGRSMPQDS